MIAIIYGLTGVNNVPKYCLVSKLARDWRWAVIMICPLRILSVALRYGQKTTIIAVNLEYVKSGCRLKALKTIKTALNKQYCRQLVINYRAGVSCGELSMNPQLLSSYFYINNIIEGVWRRYTHNHINISLKFLCMTDRYRKSDRALMRSFALLSTCSLVYWLG